MTIDQGVTLGTVRTVPIAARVRCWTCSPSTAGWPGSPAARAWSAGVPRPGSSCPARTRSAGPRRGGGPDRGRRRRRRRRAARLRAGRLRVVRLRRRDRLARRWSCRRPSSAYRDGVWWLTTVGRSDGCRSGTTRRAPPARSAAPTAPVPPRSGPAWSPRRSAGSPPARSTRWCWPGTSRSAPVARSTRAGRCGGWPPATRGCWTFAVDGLLGATPEMLVRLEKGRRHLAGAGRHAAAHR